MLGTSRQMFGQKKIKTLNHEKPTLKGGRLKICFESDYGIKKNGRKLSSN